MKNLYSGYEFGCSLWELIFKFLFFLIIYPVNSYYNFFNNPKYLKIDLKIYVNTFIKKCLHQNVFHQKNDQINIYIWHSKNSSISLVCDLGMRSQNSKTHQVVTSPSPQRNVQFTNLIIFVDIAQKSLQMVIEMVFSCSVK